MVMVKEDVSSVAGRHGDDTEGQLQVMTVSAECRQGFRSGDGSGFVQGIASGED